MFRSAFFSLNIGTYRDLSFVAPTADVLGLVFDQRVSRRKLFVLNLCDIFQFSFFGA